MHNYKNSDNFSPSLEPVFYYGLNNMGLEETAIRKNTLKPEQVKTYFEYSLKQNPKDLSRHLQRVQFCLNMENSDELYAALCDLFIILGKSGLQLRQRLLRQSKNKLNELQINTLINHMKAQELSAALHVVPDSCYFKNQLKKNTIKKVTLCDLPKTESHSKEDSLKTADSYIENSQFDAAIDYMKEILKQDEENEELTIKLINLYKALNQIESFGNAYNQFSNTLMTSHHWDDAKQYFLDRQIEV